MKVLIIEDEAPSARRLGRILQPLGVEVLEVLHSVATSVEWFRNHPSPDLIFLDIQLSDGLSFEIFEQVQVNSAIIFTTAFDEYALQAFKLNSIDYLLKPIDEEELHRAVHKYKGLRSDQQAISINFNDIRKFLANPLEREYKKRLMARVGPHIKLLNTEEIICFYSENKGTYAFTLDKRNYLLETTLEILEDELKPDMFFRVNRGFIININAIADILSYSNSRLEIRLKDFSEQQIIVSRDRVRDFKDWLS